MFGGSHDDGDAFVVVSISAVELAPSTLGVVDAVGSIGMAAVMMMARSLSTSIHCGRKYSTFQRGSTWCKNKGLVVAPDGFGIHVKAICAVFGYIQYDE